MNLKPTLLAAALMFACSQSFAAEMTDAERAAARKELDAARGELRELTKRIAEFEQRIAALSAKIQSPDFYRQASAVVLAANDELALQQAQLDQAFARWEELES